MLVGRIISQTVWASSSDSRSGSHVLRIYDDGTERGVFTDADTLQEALSDAGIVLDENDITEPSLDSELVAASYDVNIYRSRPVMVIDGDKTAKVMTPYQTAKQIAEQADISLRPEDKARLEHDSELVIEGALERLVIERAHEVMLVFYGDKTKLYTHATTVGELLEDREIVPGDDDTLSVDADTPIKPGMTIELWRNGKQTVTVDEPVKHTTREVRDADKPASYREVQTKGQDGLRKVTYEIEMRNGNEIDRREINAVTTKKPVEQLVVIGAKVENAAYTGGGNKSEWLASSNIPRSQWGNADWLVQKESGWNPNARNPSSGACGLGQQLPCGKWAGAWNDPVASLNGMHGYVMGRYGSWEAAVSHSRSVGWY